ncbi:hypothetical protein AXF42_Ash001633 [Apostasia shenzhenica]|uniref:DNA-directed RNA polymerase subunit n=1 Tax=Apostasia shenzhenica TaxID=1088818 RepID=A0A2I0AAT1_9ASPA|nr:hypothetical protein AXF42_Ash001633 [Apostasia shenzhenica]
MEGLVVAEADLTVYIHPSMANKVRRAILSQLSGLLFTYDEVFEGVVLAYEVHIRSRSAKVLPGLTPYFGVKLRANLLMFSPKPDMLIEGKVVKLGRESIHAIVLGFASAAIMLEDIREEFNYRIKHGLGTFASKHHKQHKIKVGTIVRFLVKSVDEEMLHISGSFVPPNTGCIYWLSKYSTEDGSQFARGIKRHQSDNVDNNVIEQDPSSLGQDSLLRKRRRLHKSRTLQD